MKKSKLTLLALFIIYALNICAKNHQADSVQVSFNKQIQQAGNDPKSISKIHYNYGVYLDENGDIEKAIYHLKEALQAANKIPDEEIVAKTANYLGGIYWIEGDCNTSTQYYEQALKSAELIDNKELVAIIKMNLSGNYGTSGKTEKAIAFAIEALEIKEKNNIQEGICYDYIMVGEIFQSIGNIDKWKCYVQKAYSNKDNKQSAIMTDVVMIYNNLGRIAEAEEKFEMALAYYDTIMQISEPEGYDQGMGIALLNSSLIFQIQDLPQKALLYANKSVQYFGDVPYFQMAVFNVKAETLKMLERNKEALEIASKNIQNQNIQLYPAIKQDCIALLYELNFKLHNYQLAYNWNDTLRTYEAKLRKEENKKQIEELETQYETEKKEQQIELLSAENKIKNQRIVLFVVVSILLLLVLIIGVLLYYRYKKQNHQKQENMRMQLLRSQMNPHFLFNALGSIQNYMLNNNTKEAAGYLNNFASLTRSILDHSAMNTVMLDDEIEALHNYIKLEQMRFQHSFSYSIDYDDSVETELINIPPMLIQPFVENAIKHGLRNKTKGGELKISIEDCDETLKVCVRDNGSGFDKKERANNGHKSMAMLIFNQRIALLKRKYTKRAGCYIKSSPNKGTEVSIAVPIID
jgi:tetratricopeptide (TPR) repeat protein